MVSRAAGGWQIVVTDLWDRDTIDLSVQPSSRSVPTYWQLRFVAVEGDLMATHLERQGHPALEFSRVGTDDEDDAPDRAWAVAHPRWRASSGTSTSSHATSLTPGQTAVQVPGEGSPARLPTHDHATRNGPGSVAPRRDVGTGTRVSSRRAFVVSGPDRSRGMIVVQRDQPARTESAPLARRQVHTRCTGRADSRITPQRRTARKSWSAVTR